jgi:hypothetical protein
MKDRRVPERVHPDPQLQGMSFTFSLMNSQMMRVISSPSISTTGWATLMRLSASVKINKIITQSQNKIKPGYELQLEKKGKYWGKEE